MNRPSCLRLFLLCSAVFCLASCGDEQAPVGQNNTSPPENMPDKVMQACAQVKLAALAGQPLDQIAIGVDAVAPDEDLVVEVQYDDSWALGVLADNDGVPSLVVPIHPNGMNGGTLNVRFVDDLQTSTCMGKTPQAFEVTVRALTPAPGATTQYIDTFMANLSKQAQLYGWSLEELASTPMQDIPIPLWSIAHQADMMQGQEIQNNMRKMLAGQAPVLEDAPAGDETVALIDALVAKTGMNAQMVKANMALDDLNGLGVIPKFKRVEVVPSDSFEPNKLTVADLFQVDITTASDLSFFMRMADIAETTYNHPAFKTANDMAALLSNVPRIGKVAKAVGAGLGVVGELTKRAKYFLPSRLQAAGFEVTQSSFFEDDEPKGDVKVFNVTARSERWKISQDIAEQLASMVVGARSKFAKKSGSDFGMFKPPSPGKDWVASEASSKANGEFDGRVKKALGSLFEKAIEIYIGPFAWGPFDLSELTTTSGDFAQLEVFSGDILNVPNPNASTFNVLKVGEGVLSMSANPEFFPPAINQRFSKQDLAIKVNAIQINLSPRVKVTAPGEVIDIAAQVEYARDKRLEWTTTGGTLDVAGDTLSAQLTIPDPKPDEPIKVTVKSLSKAGLRASSYDPEPREAIGVYGAKESIFISPSLPCLTKAEPVQFKAEVTAAEGSEVVWEAQEGSITQAGLYTPPSADGIYEIVAYIKGNPDVRGVTAVKIGKCRCYFYGYVAGSGRFSGPQVGVTTISPEVEFISAEEPSMAEMNSFLFTMATPTTGSIIITDAFGQTYSTYEERFATITYAEQGPVTVSGKIEGAVIKLPPDGNDPELYSFQVDFKGERSSGGPNPVCSD